MKSELDAVKRNLFSEAHAAINDWDAFPWHKHKGVIQANKPHSSQALAIDVFGTIKVSNERDRVLKALAQQCGLASDGPWDLKLEWVDCDNRLGEKRRTQVDALAISRRSIILFECKFAEPGGACSQTRLIADGAHRGKRQCDGYYASKKNPVNEKTASCALTAKKIRYWDFIPEIYGADAAREGGPCPFAGDAFQWMRNVVLAAALAKDQALSSAVVCVYADGSGFPTAQKVLTGSLGHPAASGKVLVTPISYQSIVRYGPIGVTT